jgi:hypothetical protein
MSAFMPISLTQVQVDALDNLKKVQENITATCDSLVKKQPKDITVADLFKVYFGFDRLTDAENKVQRAFTNRAGQRERQVNFLQNLQM